MLDALIAAKDYVQILLGIRVTQLDACLKEWSGFIEQCFFELAAQHYLVSSFPRLLQTFEEKKIYLLTDNFGINLLVMNLRQDNIVIFGPFLQAPANEAFCEKILTQNQLSLISKDALLYHYNTFPVCQQTFAVSAARLFLNHAYELTFNAPLCEISLFGGKKTGTDQLTDDNWDVLKRLERRYDVENALINEVQKGNSVAALKLSRALLEDVNHKISYSNNPILNQKRLITILNTLLRKAVEYAKVNIYLIDQISTRFSYQIETTNTLNELSALQYTMVADYCDLSNKHSLTGYSPVIRRAINYITLNLTKPLCLADIAESCRISPNHLSKLFNGETGESISGYINRCRVESMANLLQTTTIDTAEAAASVGFSDLNYCIKVFKSIKGVTPGKFKR